MNVIDQAYSKYSSWSKYSHLSIVSLSETERKQKGRTVNFLILCVTE